MEIKSRFDHFNINVTDLGRSLARKRATEASYWFIWETGRRDSVSN